MNNFVRLVQHNHINVVYRISDTLSRLPGYVRIQRLRSDGSRSVSIRMHVCNLKAAVDGCGYHDLTGRLDFYCEDNDENSTRRAIQDWKPLYISSS